MKKVKISIITLTLFLSVGFTTFVQAQQPTQSDPAELNLNNDVMVVECPSIADVKAIKTPLEYNQSNNNVKILQQALGCLNLSIEENITGYYGAFTKNAVKIFLSSVSISGDGSIFTETAKQELIKTITPYTPPPSRVKQYDAQIEVLGTNSPVPMYANVQIDLKITNTGSSVWENDPGYSYSIREGKIFNLGINKILGPKNFQKYNTRHNPKLNGFSLIPSYIKPGETIYVTLQFPTTKSFTIESLKENSLSYGKYKINLQMVQEPKNWFGNIVDIEIEIIKESEAVFEQIRSIRASPEIIKAGELTTLSYSGDVRHKSNAVWNEGAYNLNLPGGVKSSHIAVEDMPLGHFLPSNKGAEVQWMGPEVINIRNLLKDNNGGTIPRLAISTPNGYTTGISPVLFLQPGDPTPERVNMFVKKLATIKDKDGNDRIVRWVDNKNIVILVEPPADKFLREIESAVKSYENENLGFTFTIKKLNSSALARVLFRNSILIKSTTRTNHCGGGAACAYNFNGVTPGKNSPYIRDIGVVKLDIYKLNSAYKGSIEEAIAHELWHILVSYYEGNGGTGEFPLQPLTKAVIRKIYQYQPGDIFTPSPAVCPSLSDLQNMKTPLRYRLTANDVKTLQQGLICSNYLKEGNDSGYYEASTMIAVKTFAADSNLTDSNGGQIFTEAAKQKLISIIYPDSAPVSIPVSIIYTTSTISTTTIPTIPTPTSTPATLNQAKYKLQATVPTTVTAGQSFSASLVFKNTGNTNWTKSAGYRLGSQNPQDNNIWGLSRVELSNYETIAVGEDKMFTSNVKAPQTPGTYNFQWQMLQEGKEWFGDKSPNVVVKVEKTETVPSSTALLSAKIEILSDISKTTYGIGTPIPIQAKVMNLGSKTWISANNAFQLRAHAYLPNGIYVRDLTGNGYSLPRDVKLGESVIMNLEIPTGPGTQITTTGKYTIGVDMVQEGVQWFGNEVKVDANMQSQSGHFDSVRKNHIANIQKALEDYRRATGKYPDSGGLSTTKPNPGWLNSNDSSWNTLSDALKPYIDYLPKDPINTPDAWATTNGYNYAYYSSSYGKSNICQWYMLVYKLETEPNASSPRVVACDGTVFNYNKFVPNGGIVTTGMRYEFSLTSKPLSALIPLLSASSSISLGTPIKIQARVMNLGYETWISANNAFRLRAHAYLPNGDYIQDLVGNGYGLPKNVAPTESVLMDIEIPTGTGTQINATGTIQIGLDMVREGYAWFGNEVRVPIDISVKPVPYSTTTSDYSPAPESYLLNTENEQNYSPAPEPEPYLPNTQKIKPLSSLDAKIKISVSDLIQLLKNATKWMEASVKRVSD